MIGAINKKYRNQLHSMHCQLQTERDNLAQNKIGLNNEFPNPN